MHTPTGEIYTDIDITEMMPDADEAMNQKRAFSRRDKMVGLTQDETDMLIPLHQKQRKGWMRNQPCVCGSGKKFKRCCWHKFK